MMCFLDAMPDGTVELAAMRVARIAATASVTA